MGKYKPGSTSGENARTGFYAPAPTPVHWIVRHSSPRFAIERRVCGTVPSDRRFVTSPANLPGRLMLPLLPFREPFPDIPDIVLTAGITAGPGPGQVHSLVVGWPGPSSAVLPQLERHRRVLQQYLHVLQQHPPGLPHFRDYRERVGQSRLVGSHFILSELRKDR